MAVPGPTDRIFNIDNASLSPTAWTALVVGTPGSIAEMEEELTDFTGAASTSPVIIPGGFVSAKDVTFNFQADVGGSPDPTAEFHSVRSGSRSHSHTLATGWVFTSESYIKSAKGDIPLKNKSTVEVLFVFTGTPAVT